MNEVLRVTHRDRFLGTGRSVTRGVAVVGHGASDENGSHLRLKHVQRFRDSTSTDLVLRAGNLLKKEYGQYIDNHDIVMRFNMLSLNKGFERHVGRKATVRVFNHSRGRQACCFANKHSSAAGNGSVVYVLWHPGGMRSIADNCR